MVKTKKEKETQARVRGLTAQRHRDITKHRKATKGIKNNGIRHYD